MSMPNSQSSVNSAAVTGRMQVNPPAAPESSLWFSDREIGARHPSVALAYTADDFRQELKRSERKLYWLSFISILVAVLAVIAIIFIVLQAGFANA